MTFSYDRVWNDLSAMFRHNIAVVLTLTGVFQFLPAFAMWLFMPLPRATAETTGFTLAMTYYQNNSVVLILVGAIAVFGQLATLNFLVDRARPTVAEAVRTAIGRFPAYFAVVVFANLALAVGLTLLIVPGLYLLGRFATVGLVLAARLTASPLRAIEMGVRQTRTLGWQIAGIFLVIVIPGWIAAAAAGSVITIAGALVLPTILAPLAAALGNALDNAALSLLLSLLIAAIYREVGAIRGI